VTVSPEPNPGLASTLSTRGAPLLEALAQHSPAVAEHAEASSSYAFSLAAELGYDRDRCELIRNLAKLHEIGQIYIPSSVLEKHEAERDVTEQVMFETHYEAGAGVARGAGVEEEVCQWLLHQRERYDGSGPRGLAGEQIPIESRLLRAACVCHTVLAEPSHGHGVDRAILRLAGGAGSELDPGVAATLIAILERARNALPTRSAARP